MGKTIQTMKELPASESTIRKMCYVWSTSVVGCGTIGSHYSNRLWWIAVYGIGTESVAAYSG